MGGAKSTTHGYAAGGNTGCSNGPRGIFAGGGGTNVIEYVTISTLGNATDFGDLLVNLNGSGGFSGD